MFPLGEEAVGPSWPVVLRHELEVRKKAMRQINMFGVSLSTAFAAGRRSDELRTKYLITPWPWETKEAARQQASGGAVKETKGTATTPAAVDAIGTQKEGCQAASSQEAEGGGLNVD